MRSGSLRERNGHDWIDRFTSWLQQTQHYLTVRSEVISADAAVISFQTEWMRNQLLPNSTKTPSVLSSLEPLEGLVTDGAHKYWSNPNAILLTTSSFDSVTDLWAPGLFTYTNGVSSTHYKYHFVGVFEGIAEAAAAQSISLYDAMFAMVVDFSDPQRIGFVEAFEDFFELHDAAIALLKGCQYHYDKSVTRVSRVASAVPSDKCSKFKKYCRILRTTEKSDTFFQVVKKIRKLCPSVEPWLAWWLRPEHASMIFPSQMTMDPTLVKQLPSTTNAEEAMHAKIYKIAGKGHDLIDGLDGLLKVEAHHHGQHDHALGM
ncbi:hypothetical protein K435DRAFT_906252 [Dendrothele bispora CBS 962.96]|uniref:Uncharacterized protein n=1 Tax=Dendrothele bispora (strain CBS 962.96) TaxID=1314807 RepID=A0A4S8LT26_DENBC|nr:hypothetical protein K435DRAFT_906252 [Dendrothele bispora CBS 962.96]